MANFTLEGKLTAKMDVSRGNSARGAWAKQEFIVELADGKFPTNVCLSVWGEDKVNDLARYNAGDFVSVSFDISSREFNGRWYTDLRAWRIMPAQGQNGASGAAGAPGVAGSAGGYGASGAPQPAPFPPATAEPNPFDINSDDAADDLPF
ncbi:MAG: DUF3127 domain-containing protein [Bacteroidales bacterium]|nr:DUF3127 domain-containing protein [Bacteroidales bacterium]